MSTTDKPKTSFRTKNLNEAAFIWSQDGVDLKNVQGKQGRGTTIYFHFDVEMSEEELTKILIDYANGKTLVEPLAFCESLRKLRDALHGGLQHHRKSK